ncbi:hypothetical protein ACFQZZ_06640 [Nocardia sp. GCM10030253]|uniref:hypothetical protein n=1 Tax=Nocardia sp. GCM10030253 TaxID=3273404 RepID=UPI0036257075
MTPLEIVHLYINGQRFPGDPASYRFGAHDQVVLVVGSRWMTPEVPASYEFPPGL